MIKEGEIIFEIVHTELKKDVSFSNIFSVFELWKLKMGFYHLQIVFSFIIPPSSSHLFP